MELKNITYLIIRKDLPGFVFIRITGYLNIWDYKICGGRLKSMTHVMAASYVQRSVLHKASGLKKGNLSGHLPVSNVCGV